MSDLLDPRAVPVMWTLEFTARLRKMPRRKRLRRIAEIDQEFERLLAKGSKHPERDASGRAAMLEQVARTRRWWDSVKRRLAEP